MCCEDVDHVGAMCATLTCRLGFPFSSKRPDLELVAPGLVVKYGRSQLVFSILLSKCVGFVEVLTTFSLGYCSAVSWVDLARDIWSRAHVLRGDVIVRGEGVEGRMRCIFVSDQSEVEFIMIHYGICPV